MAKVSADLELRMQQALSDVDQLEKVLNEAVSNVGASLSEQIQTAISGEYQVEVEAEVVPEIDTAAVEAELAAIDAEAIDIAIDADTASIEEVADAVAAIDGETIDVDVQVEGTEQIEEASTQLDGLAEAAAGAATGGLSLQAAAAAAAGTFGIGALFSAATEAEGSLQSFNLRVGDAAAEIENINVGGLNEDLGELAIRLGSSDEGARNAAASIFQVGEASGVAADDVAKTTEQIIALAAQAVALNPQLGEVGAVAEGLQGGLARGGRFLANYGLTLTATEIQARALNDTGKETAAELTQYEKAAAGAAIATERLGTSIADDVDAGAENAQIRVRSLQEQVGELAEEVGGPLVDSFTESLTEVTEVLSDFEDEFVAVSETVASRVDLISSALATLDDVPGLNTLVGLLSQDADTLAGIPLIGGVLTNEVRTIDTQSLLLADALVRIQAETLGLSDAQAEAALSGATAFNGTVDLEGAYARLRITAGLAAEAEAQRAGEIEQAAEVTEKATEKSELALATWVEAIDAAADASIATLSEMGVAAEGTVDLITGAFQDLNEDGTVSLFEFTTTLQEEVAAQAGFVANIRELQARGANDLALALAEGGADARAAAAEAVTLSDENLANYEKTVDDTIAVNEYLAVTTAALNADIVASADTTAKDWEKALRSTDLAGAVEDPLLEAELVAGQGGFDVGEAAAEGFEQGLLSKREALKIIAKEEAQSVIDVWNTVLGISSPSKVFEEIGANTIAGFVEGVTGAATAAASPAFAVTMGPGAVQINVTGGDTNQVVNELAEKTPVAVTEAMFRVEVQSS